MRYYGEFEKHYQGQGTFHSYVDSCSADLDIPICPIVYLVTKDFSKTTKL